MDLVLLLWALNFTPAPVIDVYVPEDKPDRCCWNADDGYLDRVCGEKCRADDRKDSGPTTSVGESSSIPTITVCGSGGDDPSGPWPVSPKCK